MIFQIRHIMNNVSKKLNPEGKYTFIYIVKYVLLLKY